MKNHSILKKLASFVMAAALMAAAFTTTASAASVSDFKDVKAGSWYYNAVDYAVANGMFSGTTPTNFSPAAAVTRGMFVTVLGKRSGVDTSKYLNNRFGDVRQNAYYAPYIEWAAEYNIVSGTGDGKFSPEAKITREQMATILYKYAEFVGSDMDTEWSGYAYLYYGHNGIHFSDGPSASHWAEDAFGWVLEKKVMSGDGSKLNPNGTATRAQCAQVLYNARNILGDRQAEGDRYDADGNLDPNGQYDRDGWLCYLPNGEACTPENVTEFIDGLRDKYPEGPSKIGCEELAWGIVKEMGVIKYKKVENPAWDELKAGDVIRYSNSLTAGHYVLIAEKYDDHIRVVEGNYNNSIHWNREITKAEFDNFTSCFSEPSY